MKKMHLTSFRPACTKVVSVTGVGAAQNLTTWFRPTGTLLGDESFEWFTTMYTYIYIYVFTYK